MSANKSILEIGTGYTSIPSKIGAATEIVVEELTKAAINQNLDVAVFDIRDHDRPKNNLNIVEVYVPGFLAKTVETKLGIIHKLKRIVYSFSLSIRLIRYIKSDKFYILHFHNQYNFFFFYKLSSKKKRKNIQLFYTNHTSAWSNPWQEIEHLIAKKYFMESFSLRKADKVFVLNPMTSYNLINHLDIPSGKINLIPNGVNPDIFVKLPADDLTVIELRNKLNLNDRKVLIHSGAVCDRKNQLEIIKYLTPVFKKAPETVFLFAGAVREIAYHQAITEYCIEQKIDNNVIYLGELPPGVALNCYYNLAIGFIFFSKSEGFSLALLEALSSGLPVLLSKNLAMDFIRNKDSGILFFDSNQEFQDAFFTEIYPKDRQQYNSEKASQFIRSNYSWDIITRKYFG